MPRILFIITMCIVSVASVAQQRVYDILRFGATHDTTAVHTAAINAAIEACSREGGGRVVVPCGLFKTGTLTLRDNVELHLESGAQLVASSRADDFPVQPRAAYRSQKDKGGWVALIYACGAHNIAITGQGTIDGRGSGRRGRIKGFGGDIDGRPRNILLISCTGVSVEGITVRNAAMWNQHYLDCEDVTISNIHSYNHCNGNNDGIDIDGCRRLTLTNSIIDSDDDGIVLKSTGLAPCDGISISHCMVSSFANAIKCGTESTAGFRNISISHCKVRPSRHTGRRIIKSTPTGISAISLEIVDGGIMDGVSIDSIDIEGTECALYVRLANRGRRHTDEAPQPPVGQMRNITVSNISARNVGNFSSSITGIPGAKIESIVLSNISVSSRGGLKRGLYRHEGDDEGQRHDVGADLHLDRYWRKASQIKEDEDGYPQPTVWGNLPCHGLFARHVGSLTLRNVRFTSEHKDPRPAIITVDVDKKVIAK